MIKHMEIQVKSRQKTIWDYGFVGCCSLVLLASVVVMCGWYIGSQRLVQISPTFVPMQFNTALCLSLLSSAFMAIYFRFRQVAWGLLALVMLIVCLTLIEYLFYLNFGIDELFHKHQITIATSHAGRMAPNTALCFLSLTLVAMSVLLNLGKTWVHIELGILFLILMISILSILGYLAGYDRVYTWGALTGMALHTAAGMALLAVSGGLLIKLLHRVPSRFQFAHVLPAVLFVVSVVFFIALWIVLINQKDRTVRENIQRMGDLFVSGIKAEITQDVVAIRRLYQRYQTDGYRQFSDFKADANHYIQDMPAIDVISFAASHQFMLRQDDITVDKGQAVVRECLQNYAQQNLATDAMRVVQWRQGLCVVSAKKQLVSVLSMRAIVNRILPATYLDEYGYKVTLGSNTILKITANETQEHIAEWSSTQNISIGQNVITIKLWPRLSMLNYYSSRLPSVLLLSGLILSALLSACLAFWLQMRDNNARLRREIVTKKLANKELRDFTYMASHDLRIPLSGLRKLIIGVLEESRADLSVDSVQKLKRISTLLTQTEGLLTDLQRYNVLLVAKLDYQKMSLFTIIHAAQDSLKSLIQKKAAEIDIVGALPEVTADAKLLQEVFAHLLTNAISYNHSPQPAVKVSCVEKADVYVIRIQDNGIGIDASQQERVFGIFQRVLGREEYAGGTGAGLAISKRIIEMHGGSIWIESAVNEGTEVIMTLPKRPVEEG